MSDQTWGRSQAFGLESETDACKIWFQEAEAKAGFGPMSVSDPIGSLMDEEMGAII